MNAAYPLRGSRAAWVGLRVVLGLLLLWVICVVAWSITNLQAGFDYQTYMAAVGRWLSGGSFYEPYQLAGPYQVVNREVLYPPIILPLLAAFSILPAILWWIVPMGIFSGVVVRWRPSLVGWAAILACLGAIRPIGEIVGGNPVMWIAAFVALGTIWGWPAVFVALKPTLLPFMFIGIRRRSWWVAAAALTIISMGFLPLWFAYAHVLLNARGPLVNPLYSLGDVPLLLIPIVARATSLRRPVHLRTSAHRAPAEVPAETLYRIRP